MRENKFRAVFEPDGGLECGYLMFHQVERNDRLYFVHVEEEGEREIVYNFEIPFLDDDWKLLQFTGLTDKKDMDLYENDLVMNGRDMVVYQVVWVEENAKFILDLVTKNPNACIELEMCPLTLSLFQCIGNIYEKPEWLELENG